MDPQFEIATCTSLLSEWRSKTFEFAFTQQEALRAEAIVSTARREQFLAGRWLAKKMLVQSCGGAPESWQIDADGSAKPGVIGHDLQLSISHSGPYVACCIADHAVGIDIEGFGHERPVVDLATLACSAREQSALRSLQGDALNQSFFQLWTCKEARLKQFGASFDLNAMCALETMPAERAQAQVGTWCFMGQQKVMLSLAVEGLSRVSGRCPAGWVVGPAQWQTYI